MASSKARPHPNPLPLSYAEVMRELQSHGRLESAPPGVTLPSGSYMVTAPVLHALARRIGRNHDLAQTLWASAVHPARILATLVDDPRQVTEEQMEAWVRDVDSWDLCDALCGYLFDRVPWSYVKAVEWSSRPEEYVKRAGFALMAFLTVHDKKTGDEVFASWFPLIAREATDPRHFVKKAVNWALRQIGKRNPALNERAIATARDLRALESASARWIAADALRELTGTAVQSRLQRTTSALASTKSRSRRTPV